MSYPAILKFYMVACVVNVVCIVNYILTVDYVYLHSTQYMK